MKKHMMRWVFSVLCIAVFLPAFNGFAEGNQDIRYLDYMIWAAPREWSDEPEPVEIGYSAVADIDLGALGGKEGQYAVYYEDEEGNTRTEAQDHDGYPYILIRDLKNDIDLWAGKLSEGGADGAESAVALRFHPYQHGVRPEYITNDADLPEALSMEEYGEPDDKGELVVPIGIYSEGKYILYVDADKGYRAKQGDESLIYDRVQGGFIVEDTTGAVQIYRYDTELGKITGIGEPENWVVPTCEIAGIDPEKKAVQVELEAEAAEGYDISGLQWKYRIVRGENEDELREIPIESRSGGIIDLEALEGLRSADTENTRIDEDIIAIEIGLYKGDEPVQGEEGLTTLSRDDFFPAVELGNPQIHGGDDGKGSIEGEIIIAQGRNRLGKISVNTAALLVSGKYWSPEALTPSENGYDFTAVGDLPEGGAADVQLRVLANGSESKGKLIECKAEIKDVKINEAPRIALEAVLDKPTQAVEITAVDVRNQEYDTLLHGIKVYAALPGGERKEIIPNSDGSFEVRLDEETTMKGKVQYRKIEAEEWFDGLPAHQAGVCNQTYQIRVEAEGFAPQYLQSEGGNDWIEATINIVPLEVYVDVTAEQISKNIYSGEEQEIDFHFEVSCVQPEEPGSAPTGAPVNALKAEIAALGDALTEALNEAYSGDKIKCTDAGDYPKEYTVETFNPNFALKAQDQKLTVQVVATIEKETVTIPTKPVCYVYDGEEHRIGTGSLGEIEKVLSRSENYYSGCIDTDKLEKGHVDAGVYVTELDCGGLSEKNRSYSIDPWIMVILRQSIDPDDKRLEDIAEKEILEAVLNNVAHDKDKIINDYACYAGMTVELVHQEVEYNGDIQAPEPKFRQNGEEKALVEGADYELRYYKDAERTEEVKNPNFVSAGVWYISVIGKGNYAGTFKVEEPYTIRKGDKAEVEVSIEGWTHDGQSAGGEAHSSMPSGGWVVYYDEEGNKIDVPPSDAGESWPETKN